MTARPIPDALADGPAHPRPQLVRARWHDLGGAWSFGIATDDRAELSRAVFDRRITVPFPPESPASGVGETGPMPAVWYRRTIDGADLEAAGRDEAHPRVLLHFGAVDHRATVWVDDALVATHVGGQTPFTIELTDLLHDGAATTLTVCAIDPIDDVSMPRGKQDWRIEPHGIWYHRTTGIWQPVWLECVPDASVAALAWECDLASGTVEARVAIDGAFRSVDAVRIRVTHDGEVLADVRASTLGLAEAVVPLALPAQRNGQQAEDLWWRPGHPVLLGASVTLESADGRVLDRIGSYLGMRSVAVDGGRLLLNDRPIRMRAVLAQNVWPDTHLAATDEMLRREVELILALGFDTARVHQKAEDPRFLYWADRLGLMVWAETANAYAFDDRAVALLATEWMALVTRDRSHPCVVVQVPINESWGVQHLAHDPRRRAYSRALADLTRALDGTRPVVSNDGWEHTASDLVTVHDYEGDPAVLGARYADADALARLQECFGPAGRRILLGTDAVPAAPPAVRPVLLTEFGGVSLRSDDEGGWGYTEATDADEFERRVAALLRAAAESKALAGFCYTQLTDTGQEVNGLLRADRTPKVPVERIPAAVQAGD